MQQAHDPARLIVAADFRPDPSQSADWVRDRVLELADDLSHLGVTLKVNSALRACGYDLITDIRARRLAAFADLKLNDISETLGTDGSLLFGSSPQIVTAMCASGVAALKELRAALPYSTVVGVTVLTSIKDAECEDLYGMPVAPQVGRFVRATKRSLDGFVCSPAEITMVREIAGPDALIVTPGIRPSWAQVTGDDQNQKRVSTPQDAVALGASHLVVGRPITLAKNRRDAAKRTLEEMFG